MSVRSHRRANRLHPAPKHFQRSLVEQVTGALEACRMLARCRAPGSVLRQQIENVLDVCDELGHTLEGSRWAALAREFDCCIRGITEEEWKLEVMKEAHALLDTYFADQDVARSRTNASPRN